MVTVYDERAKRTHDERHDGPIAALLAKLGINPETVVIVKNGAVVAETATCNDEDELKLLSVISGG